MFSLAVAEFIYDDDKVLAGQLPTIREHLTLDVEGAGIFCADVLRCLWLQSTPPSCFACEGPGNASVTFSGGCKKRLLASLWQSPSCDLFTAGG